MKQVSLGLILMGVLELVGGCLWIRFRSKVPPKRGFWFNRVQRWFMWGTGALIFGWLLLISGSVTLVWGLVT